MKYKKMRKQVTTNEQLILELFKVHKVLTDVQIVHDIGDKIHFNTVPSSRYRLERRNLIRREGKIMTKFSNRSVESYRLDENALKAYEKNLEKYDESVAIFPAPVAISQNKIKDFHQINQALESRVASLLSKVK